MHYRSIIARIRASSHRLRRICARTTFAAAIACVPQCGDLSQMIKDMGFQEISPPSNISGPGSVIYIKQDHPLRTGLICTTRHSLGVGFIPREYDTRQSQFSKTKKRHFALSADVLSQVRADASMHSISNVSVTLTNPKIYIVDDTDVFSNLPYRSKVCKESILRRMRAKFKVSMISETLEGDISYCITWDSGAHLSAEAKVDLLTNLRAKLKLGDANIKGNCIVGHALVWGVVDDRWLAQESAPDAIHSHSLSSHGSVELNDLTEPGGFMQIEEDSAPLGSLPHPSQIGDVR